MFVAPPFPAKRTGRSFSRCPVHKLTQLSLGCTEKPERAAARVVAAKPQLRGSEKGAAQVSTVVKEPTVTKARCVRVLVAEARWQRGRARQS